jgi:V/A-type H+-transporting ATPase subunit F
MDRSIETAIVGMGEEILLFNAVGIQAFVLKDLAEAEAVFSRLSLGGCKIIYVSEELYIRIPDIIEKYQFSAVPILLPIPTGKTSMGIGLKRIADNVESAIGIDIF